MPRTRIHGRANAEKLRDQVRSQGGRRVRVREMVGHEGEHSEWFLVTWERPGPFNISSHLWWMLAIAIALALWQINS